MFPKKRNINLIIDFIYIEMIDFFKIGIREIFKKEYYDIAKALAKRRMILTVEVTNPINKCSIKGILNEEGLQCSAIMNCSSIIDLLEGSKCNIYITFKEFDRKWKNPIFFRRTYYANIIAKLPIMKRILENQNDETMLFPWCSICSNTWKNKKFRIDLYRKFKEKVCKIVHKYWFQIVLLSFFGIEFFKLLKN